MGRFSRRYLRINTISDRRIWEQFWEDHAPQALFQSWLWGEVIKRQSLPLSRFGLYDGSRLVGLFQVVTVHARRGTYLHLRHGPILIDNKPDTLEHVVKFLRAHAKGKHASFIRMSPPLEDTDDRRLFLRSLGMLPSAVHEVDAERCWVVDITPREETLISNMRKTTRYEIRRAEKLGVRVVRTANLADLDQFFALYRETARRQHFLEHRGIQEEFAVFAKERKAVLLLGYYQNSLLSAAVVLFSGNQAVYHHSASIHSKFSVNYAVQWEAIRQAKRRGMHVYNFWGIAPLDQENHPWRGITVFKTGFGGNEVRTMHAHDLPLSATYWATRSIEWWECLRRGY